MSYDFEIFETPDPETCPPCGHTDEPWHLYLGSPTYNIGGMFHEACGKDENGEDLFYQHRAVDIPTAHAMWRRALFEFIERFEHYRAMEPSNKWGTLESAMHSAKVVLAAVERIIEHGGHTIFNDDSTVVKRFIPIERLRFRP